MAGAIGKLETWSFSPSMGRLKVSFENQRPVIIAYKENSVNINIQLPKLKAAGSIPIVRTQKKLPTA